MGIVEGSNSGSEPSVEGRSPADSARPTTRISDSLSPQSHNPLLDTTASREFSNLLGFHHQGTNLSSPTVLSDSSDLHIRTVVKTEPQVTYLPGSPPATPPEGHGVTLCNPLTLLSEVCITTMPSPASDIGANSPDDSAQLSLEDLGVTPENQGAHSDGFDYLYSSTSALETQRHNIHEAAYFRAYHKLKQETDDPDLDPINIGIVTEEEVRELFTL